MKNRIWSKAKRLGMSVVLFTTMMSGNWGQLAEIQAAEVDNPGIGLVQTAQWTDSEQYRAEIIMEISGLKAYGASDTIEEWSEVPEGELVEMLESVVEETETMEYSEGIPEPVEEETSEPTPEPTAAPTAEPTMTPTAEPTPEPEPIPQLYLINYISEYFQLDTEALPQNCQTEIMSVLNQNGEETTITKVTYPINLTSVTEENLLIIYPVILREEYRIAENNIQYPVCQDEPLNKDRPGAGAFVLEETENQSTVLAETLSPVLEIQAANSDFFMELRPELSQIKAGQAYTYELDITNTGELPLSDIMINSSFSMEEIKAVWESAPGIQVNGKQAVLTRLDKGETYTLLMTVQLTEAQSGDLSHTVYAEARRPGNANEIMRKEAAAGINIIPLTADFTVEKTADRTEAAPGDTITYQICIRNTGERTLHSVLSTERFVSANIQAQFMPKEGVILNSTKTQALIKEIAPGEAFALLAAVTLPRYFSSQELVNQVTVVSEETGSRNVQSEAGITVIAPLPTPTITPISGIQSYYSPGNGTKSAYPASTKPQTGDETEVGVFVMLLIFAFLCGAGVFWKVKGKSRH